MRALLLIANTSPQLILTIIKNKLGKNKVAVDPKKPTSRPIVFLTDFNSVIQAHNQDLYTDAILITLVNPLVLNVVKGAIPLDFSTENAVLNPVPHCRFDLLFDLYEKTNERHTIKFSKKSLLEKIVDKKISGNIISLVQSCSYISVPKIKHKALHRLVITWLKMPAKKRPHFPDYLTANKFKNKPFTKDLDRKFNNWLKLEKTKQTPYNDFFIAARTLANPAIAELAKKYGIDSFDGITLAAWAKL